jgi:putative colanic acid biosynthesis acetyltransferase WcaF
MSAIKERYETKVHQANRTASPWSKWHRIKGQLWSLVWLFLCRPTPKTMKGWRLMWLRIFGADVVGRPYVDPRARVKYPWHLRIEAGACIGPDSNIYNLGRVIIRERVSITQEVYVCAGTHDLSDPKLPLMTAPVEFCPDAFIGVRALILPGVVIGQGAVIGGGAVVTRDAEPWTVYGGNPAKEIGKRTPVDFSEPIQT